MQRPLDCPSVHPLIGHGSSLAPGPVDAQNLRTGSQRRQTVAERVVSAVSDQATRIGMCVPLTTRREREDAVAHNRGGDNGWPRVGELFGFSIARNNNINICNQCPLPPSVGL